MKLIVGLGNPGKKYQKTRHNVGDQLLAALATHWEVASSDGNGFAVSAAVVRKFEADCLEVDRGGEKILLMAPVTFMNESGRSVRAAATFYKVPPESVLVLGDDLNLPCGKLRLRGDGSSGGQKGLQNILDQLVTPCVPRLRIGIGRPPDSVSAVNYVLGRLTMTETRLIEESFPTAIAGIDLWIRLGLSAAMNRVNPPPVSEKKPETKPKPPANHVTFGPSQPIPPVVKPDEDPTLNKK